ncbi:MAG: hypothetical protein ACYS6K_13830 [Planctomycetota bacterium]
MEAVLFLIFYLADLSIGHSNRHDVGEGIMLEEPAKILGSGFNTNVVETANNGNHNPTKATASRKIADDDAAAVIIENSLQAETADIQQDKYKSNVTVKSIIRENQFQLKQLKKQLSELDNDDDLERLKKELKAIKDFQGFLLGVHEKIDEYTKYVEFRLEQISAVEQSMAEINENLELGRFTIARMRKEVMKALSGQAQLEPGRVLHLLKQAVQADTA